jgi:hypothetical protein
MPNTHTSKVGTPDAGTESHLNVSLTLFPNVLVLIHYVVPEL